MKIGSLEFYDKILYVNKLSETQEGTYTLNFSKIVENRNTNIKSITYSSTDNATYNGEYKYLAYIEQSNNTTKFNGKYKYDGERTYSYDDSSSILYISKETLNNTFSFDSDTLQIRLNGTLYESEYWLCKSPFDANYIEVFGYNYLDLMQNAKLLTSQESLLLYYTINHNARKYLYFCYDDSFNTLKGITTTYNKWVENNKSNLTEQEIENTFKNLTYNNLLTSNKEDVKILKYLSISPHFYKDIHTNKPYSLLDKYKFGDLVSQHKIYRGTDEIYPKQFNQSFEFSKEYLTQVPLDSSYSYYNFSIASEKYIEFLKIHNNETPLEINYCLPQNYTKLDLSKNYITYYGKVTIPRKVVNDMKDRKTAHPYTQIVNKKFNSINSTLLAFMDDLDRIEDGVSCYGTSHKNFNFSISTNSLLMLYDPIASIDEWHLKRLTKVSIKNKIHTFDIIRNNYLFDSLNLYSTMGSTYNQLLFSYINFNGVNAKIINYNDTIPENTILQVNYTSNKYLGYIPPEHNNNSIEIFSNSSKEHYIKIVFKSFEVDTGSIHSNIYGLKITYKNKLYFIPINNNTKELQEIAKSQEVVFYLGKDITKLELIGGIAIKLANVNDVVDIKTYETLFDYNIPNKYQLSITSARIYKVQYLEYFILENYNEIEFLNTYSSISSSSFKIYTKKDKAYNIDIDKKDLSIIADVDKIQE